MDIGLHHRAIYSHLAVLLDPFALPIGGQDTIDGLPGLGGYGLDVAIESGLLKSLQVKPMRQNQR